jgi:hypothetical protein
MEVEIGGRPPDLEVRDVLGVEPRQVRVFRDERGQIRLTLLDDRSYLQVKAMAAFPLTDPTEYVGLADGQNKQICMVRDLSELDEGSRELVRELLDARYFTPRILRVPYVKDEFGVAHFKVETDRGPREFYVRNVRDSMQDLPNREQLLTDVDGNRFILPDLPALDKESRAKMMTVL